MKNARSDWYFLCYRVYSIKRRGVYYIFIVSNASSVLKSLFLNHWQQLRWISNIIHLTEGFMCINICGSVWTFTEDHYLVISGINEYANHFVSCLFSIPTALRGCSASLVMQGRVKWRHISQLMQRRKISTTVTPSWYGHWGVKESLRFNKESVF